MKRIATILASGILLSGCVSTGKVEYPDQTQVITGPKVKNTATPYTSALICTGQMSNVDKDVKVGVGKVPDLTGKFSESDGGYKLTQGAPMMVQNALGKVSGVQAVERIDTSVAEFERKLASQKVIGDEEVHQIGNKKVNWRPVLSGSVLGSDYYITGAITELNYNIFSGGAEVAVDNGGPGVRHYVVSIGVDLRLVNTESLEVVDSVSMRKQVVGYETKLGIFRFFDQTLVDVNAGEKSQEPIHLAVRSVIEAGTTQLVGTALKSNSVGCVEESEKLFYDEDMKFEMLNNPESMASELVSRLVSSR